MVQLADYDGPLKKVVGTFARPLERKAVQRPPHYKPGANCARSNFKGKFVLFVQDSVEPVAFLASGFNAGLDQAEDTDPSYGQGAQGYGKRFGAEFAGQLPPGSLRNLRIPGYFRRTALLRLARGPARQRFLHAMEHAVVAHRDDGTRMFIIPNGWDDERGRAGQHISPGQRTRFLSCSAAGGLQHPSRHGFRRLREFWPEISGHSSCLPR